MNIYAVTRKGKNKKESDDRIVMDDNILNDTARLFENYSPKILASLMVLEETQEEI